MKKTIAIFSIIALVVVSIITVVVSIITVVYDFNVDNTEIELREKYNAQLKVCESNYDKMWNTKDMGFDAYPTLIIGITSDNLITSEEKESKFEVHDKKGKPTGKFEVEVETTYTAVVKGEQVSVVNESDNVYHETIEELLGLDNIENLESFCKVYDQDPELADFIIGAKVMEVDVNYNPTESVEIKEINDTIEMVKLILNKYYGYQGDVEAHLISNGSW